mmetsp:Transcript_66400/g.192432  ORF Transcript_66400/g.192432 Transcript_66400/m.192432 type:complete len:275 (+) Transcript_66400:597-1421(+)
MRQPAPGQGDAEEGRGRAVPGLRGHLPEPRARHRQDHRTHDALAQPWVLDTRLVHVRDAHGDRRADRPRDLHASAGGGLVCEGGHRVRGSGQHVEDLGQGFHHERQGHDSRGPRAHPHPRQRGRGQRQVRRAGEEARAGLVPARGKHARGPAPVQLPRVLLQTRKVVQRPAEECDRRVDLRLLLGAPVGLEEHPLPEFREGRLDQARGHARRGGRHIGEHLPPARLALAQAGQLQVRPGHLPGWHQAHAGRERQGHEPPEAPRRLRAVSHRRRA